MENKLIEKVKKLLALSESSNEYEAKVAMLKAQELLVNHKLSLKEVMNCKNIKINIAENRTSISFTKARWKGALANVITENFE